MLPKWIDTTPKKGNSHGQSSESRKLGTDQFLLVRESLRDNPLTVVSIFVNPAQFAPHEDLATYPRALEADLRRLREVSVETKRDEGPAPSATKTEIRKPSAVFIPSVKDMYPSGITTNVAEQRGAFVQVKGLEEQMEGKSRPGFFRGVATVVLKLFNAVEVCDGISVGTLRLGI
jgi:pantoate--beta-alanine ligase